MADEKPNADKSDKDDGGNNRKTPTSVYVAYPGSKVQIEVFDPDPARALRLVTSGHIQPVP